MVLIGTISHSAQPSRWWLVVAALLVLFWGAQQSAIRLKTAPTGLHETGSQQTTRALKNRGGHYYAASYVQSTPELALQLRDADDLMAFIERAKIDPGAGGYYYALKAYDFCSREAKVAGRVPRLDELFSNAHGLIDVRQVSAWMRISALCRNFPESSRDMSYFALAEEGLNAGDPKLALALRLERLSAAPLESVELKDPDARADLLMRIFAMHDPVLLRDLALELQVLQATVSFSLDDEALSPEDGDRLVDALMFIACTWGGTCGRIDDRAALLSCAHQGVCVPLPYGADMDARSRRMVDSLLATNGTALRFAPPEPVAASGLRPSVFRRAS
jgi:hypothetical protein